MADDIEAREELSQVTGGRLGVPVITVGDEVVTGFDRGRLQDLLNL